MFQANRKQNKPHSLAANAVLNIIKQCCGILFPMITYPLVARALGKESLGRYSFAESIVSYFTMIATLGIPSYAVREGARLRSDREKINAFCAQVFTINLVAMIAAMAVLAMTTLLVPRLRRETSLIAVLSINVIAVGFGRDWINNIFEDFAYITVRYVILHTLSLVLILLFIRTPQDSMHYTAIMTVAASGGYIMNLFYTQRFVPLRIAKDCRPQEHLRPILSLFCITVATTIYIRSDITILGFLRTDAEVGVYTLVSKMYSIVKSLANALITVTIPRLASYLGQKEDAAYKALMNKLFGVLCVFLLPCVVGLSLLSGDVVTLFGGSEYAEGGATLAILCLALGFAVFGCFYAQGVLVTHRMERSFLFATIVSAMVNIVLNFMLIPSLGINGAAVTTVLAETIVFFICRYYSRGLISMHGSGMPSVFVGCAAIVAICVGMHIWLQPGAVRVTLSVVFSASVYFIILLIMKNKTLWTIIGNIMIAFNKKN